jgi:hypothetical protein
MSTGGIVLWSLVTFGAWLAGALTIVAAAYLAGRIVARWWKP